MIDIIKPIYPAATGGLIGRNVADITDLIIHHSAGNPDQTPYEIDDEHRARGFSMIGYNYLIGQHGDIWEGRPAQYVPAAAYGRNTQSINVCVLGNFQHDDPGYTGSPTPEQVTALEELSVYLHGVYTTIVRTIGHRDVAVLFYTYDQADYSTACPGDELYALIPAVRLYTKTNLHGAT